MKKADIDKLVRYCQDSLDFSEVSAENEYGYASLPLCVIDAVYSIGALYASTWQTVLRFCEFFGFSYVEDPLKMSEFLDLYRQYGDEGMANQVYQNRQRTSTRNGILKSAAVRRFGEVLAGFGVESKSEMEQVLGEAPFEAAIQEIPGQRSGISLRYFYMLAGDDNFIKPDRMVNRFVFRAVGQTFELEETTILLREAAAVLGEIHPGLTPRLLDNLIWQFQRQIH